MVDTAFRADNTAGHIIPKGPWINVFVTICLWNNNRILSKLLYQCYRGDV